MIASVGLLSDAVDKVAVALSVTCRICRKKCMIARRAGIAALIGGLLLCAAPTSSQTPGLVVGVDQVPACKEESGYAKLVAEKETAAFNRALGAAILAGECTILRRGEAVFATGYSPQSHLIRVRRKDFPTDFWIAANLLGSQ